MRDRYQVRVVDPDKPGTFYAEVETPVLWAVYNEDATYRQYNSAPRLGRFPLPFDVWQFTDFALAIATADALNRGVLLRPQVN